MIVLNDEAERALLDELRAIPGTADIVQALALARREPDLYRIVHPLHPRSPPSNWRPTPAPKLTNKDGQGAVVEYAYVC